VEALTLGLRFSLALIFLTAGVAKLSARAEFSRAVVNYKLLPERVSRTVASWLPPVELVCGALLAAGVLQTPIAAALALLVLVFTGAVAVNLLRGRHIDCGCLGGGMRREISWFTVVRNLVLVVAALLLAADPSPALSVPGAWKDTATSTLSSSDVLGVLAATTTLLVTVTLGAEALRARGALAAWGRFKAEIGS
jgi:uncharacterized membrane protein YphA (DoxX/SURF4 family)